MYLAAFGTRYYQVVLEKVQISLKQILVCSRCGCCCVLNRTWFILANCMSYIWLHYVPNNNIAQNLSTLFQVFLVLDQGHASSHTLIHFRPLLWITNTSIATHSRHDYLCYLQSNFEGRHVTCQLFSSCVTLTVMLCTATRKYLFILILFVSVTFIYG